jgi:hypothetical protein
MCVCVSLSLSVIDHIGLTGNAAGMRSRHSSDGWGDGEFGSRVPGPARDPP